MRIQFFNADRSFSFKGKKQLKTTIEEIFIKEKKQLSSLNYIFCSDDYLLDINNKFLQHNYYTDIITFNLSETKEEIIGEVYVSIDRIKDNCLRENTKYNEELLRVLFHGALHLCGYKDKTKTEIKKMRGKENEYINNYPTI
jgi:probable rRNA maturation factor